MNYSEKEVVAAVVKQWGAVWLQSRVDIPHQITKSSIWTKLLRPIEEARSVAEVLRVLWTFTPERDNEQLIKQLDSPLMNALFATGRDAYEFSDRALFLRRLFEQQQAAFSWLSFKMTGDEYAAAASISQVSDIVILAKPMHILCINEGCGSGWVPY